MRWVNDGRSKCHCTLCNGSLINKENPWEMACTVDGMAGGWKAGLIDDAGNLSGRKIAVFLQTRAPRRSAYRYSTGPA